MASRSTTRAPIALLTDFGYRDHYAGAMRGVIASIAPGASIVDITHGIPPQQVSAGALALRESWRYFPRGTIFVSVVDPGVGTSRKSVAVRTRAGAYFVGPDNGLLSPAAEAAGMIAAVELTSPRYRLERVSSTFHGRDIFAPAAAWLWRGVELEAFGKVVRRIESLDIEGSVSESRRQISGSVIYVDGYGNLVTNISRMRLEQFADRLRQCRLSIRIKRRASIEVRNTYSEVRPGAPLATFGSFEMLEVAVRNGSAAAYFDATVGTAITVRAED